MTDPLSDEELAEMEAESEFWIDDSQAKRLLVTVRSERARANAAEVEVSVLRERIGILENEVDALNAVETDNDDPYAHYPGGWEGWMRDNGRSADI